MITFKEFLNEGNPLAQMHKHAMKGRHFVALTSEREGKSKKENEKNFKELKKKVQSQGYGFREAEGHWEGNKEKSLIVHAKKPGREAGAELMKHMRAHAQHYDQDSIFHHDGKRGRLVGTNETGYPGKGKVDNIGKMKYNRDKAYHQTELRPGGKRAPARFTATKD